MFLPGESQGQGSLVGCRLWSLTESDTTEATQQQQQQQHVSFYVHTTWLFFRHNLIISVIKVISPEYSLEGLMLKLKLQ